MWTKTAEEEIAPGADETETEQLTAWIDSHPEEARDLIAGWFNETELETFITAVLETSWLREMIYNASQSFEES